MRRFIPFPVSLVLLVCACALAPFARAGTLRDDADFFSSDTETRVKQTLDRIQQRHGKNVVIETYPSPPSSVPTGGSEQARNQGFDRWMTQRGKEIGADVLVLVTRSPSRVQAGSSEAMRTSGAFTADDHRATSKLILDQFRQRNFDEGIVQAVQFIDQRLGQNTGPERNAGAAAAGAGTQSGTSGGQSSRGSPQAPASSDRSSSPQGSPGVACGGGMGSLLCIGVAIVVGFMLIRGIMSRRSGHGGGYQQPGYGQGPMGGGYGQPGYGQPGYGQPGAGGFGRGVMGGVLGGLLGGWLMNRNTFGGPGALGGGSDPNAGGQPSGLPPTDPSTFADSGGSGFSSSGGDFGGGDSGGGGDSSSGGD